MNNLQLAFVNYFKDAYIVVEGKQNADRFFIIRQGKVRISKEVEVVAEEKGNILGPGDFFGVISTMSSHSHIETAQAVTDVTLISVQKEQYGQLIQNNTPVAMKIIMEFSRRLRYLDEALSRLTLKDTTVLSPSHLFNVAEYYVRQSNYNLAYYAYQKYLIHCPEESNVNMARQRMAKIAPYVTSVKANNSSESLTRSYPKGTMIFAEGEPGEELYIIQKGSVKIAKILDNNEVLLAVLKTGDIFGEMALLEAKPRVASAVAYEDCVVLAVNKSNFVKMIGTQPQMIARLTTLLSERIWFIYKQLANTLISDPLGRMYDALLIQLEKNRIPVTTTNSHSFDFGPKELGNMVGLSADNAKLYLRQMLENKKIRVLDDKIYVMSVVEIFKQTEYYRKMQKIEKSRQEGKMQQ
ncbi:MAG: cyclic nucleotide-binding domain-containing protein [Treponema sp.]|jgi:CRP-like cAMP-binding protein|nr:cyclic nucleotide-binding domain-containing protein [Treponema sp.]